MRIPPWRLALSGGAIVLLAAIGVGLVAASTTSPATPAAPVAAAPSDTPSASPGESNSGAAVRERLRDRLGALPAHPIRRAMAQHLIQGTLRFTDRNGDLVTVQLDHGTITAIGAGSLTVGEADGSSVTVATDDNTVVFLGGWAGKGTLADLQAGDQIFVQSRVDGGVTLAKRIVIVPDSSAS
jgi:hypothetical protein